MKKMSEKELISLVKKEVSKQVELGCRGDIQTLMSLTKRGENFCREIFWKFRDELEKKLNAQNNGFVIYPGSGNKGYNFDVEKMINWIKENEDRIFV